MTPRRSCGCGSWERRSFFNLLLCCAPRAATWSAHEAHRKSRTFSRL